MDSLPVGALYRSPNRIPSTVVPKVAFVGNVTPSRVWMSFNALAAARKPTASASARCVIAIVTWPVGSNLSFGAPIQPRSTATAAKRIPLRRASRSVNVVEPPGCASGAYARTIARAKSFLDSITSGRNS